ncbi:gliding motility-associated C-terminal domain-containing protein [Chitinophaga sp. sic0106]|uniref:T9SS type B sorting domain-containing protein n=1 Tax=Chitinophaga sp. sic0106 TaxID=2854785 RepID=UPI001C43D452|nr:gliding motility-associated C-terminal domain-containing protein [Chitinophaga sp. sic0106]MBV7529513.1 gliding motility-associated C-terminal domain-containing protein [Chitinophaga sp. sic0106]
MQLLKTLTAMVAVALLNNNPSFAQDISLGNPSIEGPPKAGNVPVPWYRAFQSPDTQPGNYGITLPASDGKTYAGFIIGNRWQEGISQQLPTPLKAGSTYQLSFDLAFPVHYDTLTLCTGTMAVYGTNSPTEQGELLWQSGTFTHEQWQRYTANMRPAKDYNYILLMSYLPPSCPGKSYAGALVDHLSPSLAQAPNVTFAIQPTCKGKSTGKLTVIATGGKPPYTYEWQQHGEHSATIANLAEGQYSVTVRSANGTSVTAVANVEAYTLEVKAMPDMPLCYGDANGAITLHPQNGVGPFEFAFANGTFSQDSVYDGLKAGNYRYAATDAVGCMMSATAVLPQPDALQFSRVKIHHVSCTDVTDGKIVLSGTGGTAPYTYRLQYGPWQADSLWNGLDAGDYHLQIKDKNNCEINTDSSLIRYIRECAVFMPTAFSPNLDGQNDVFRAKVHDAVTDFRLAVYSRWGELTFETRDPEGGWDGMYRGKKAQAQVYVWILTYTDSRQQARKQTGTVTLVR